jgi:pimeloyl-ACP methyl ester carboxylesterase
MNAFKAYIIGGFGSTIFYYLPLKKRLERLGVSCNIISPGHFGLNIWSLRQFEERAAKILLESPGKISLIGHSLGGIQAMWLAFNYPDKIDKIFAISSPVQGSPLKMYEGVILRILDVPKDLWTAFQQTGLQVISSKIVTLSSSKDLIAPTESCMIKGAKNYQININVSCLTPSPHILIPFLPLTAKCIVSEIS